MITVRGATISPVVGRSLFTALKNAFSPTARPIPANSPMIAPYGAPSPDSYGGDNAFVCPPVDDRKYPVTSRTKWAVPDARWQLT